MDAPAFDPVAGDYDAQFTDTAVGRAQRDVVRACLGRTIDLAAGPAVLELNCGTGADARWMAAQGATVTATDLSPEMVATAQQAPGAAAVDWRSGDMRDIVRESHAAYDVVFSNFGGLNCIDADDFRELGQDCRARLRPGGYWVGVVMSHFCLWEAVYYTAKGRPDRGFRRLGRRPLSVPLGGGQFQETWYYGPREVRAMMGPGWELEAVVPVGFFLPPSYLAPWFARRPRFLRTLRELEMDTAAVSSRAAWSDHFLLALRRT